MSRLTKIAPKVGTTDFLLVAAVAVAWLEAMEGKP